MINKRQNTIIKVLAILLVLSLAFVAWTGWRIFTQEAGQETVTSGGLTVAKPTNNVKDATIDKDGNLTFVYEDGSSRVVGNIVGVQGPQGNTGNRGPAPTQAEIALAIVNYCADGRCDAKKPSADQVATAVYNYCSTGACKGATGDTGSAGANATAEQVMAAVTQYCADGRCRGPQGAQGVSGQNGINGRTTVMSCVIRTTNSLATQYVAWKYEDEANTAYRDLYKLPTWAQGSDCVDLREA